MDYHETMTLLQRCLRERFNIFVPGDNIAMVGDEARINHEGTTFYARYLQIGNQPHELCGPVLYCDLCGRESLYRPNCQDQDELAHVLYEGAYCDCEAPTTVAPTSMTINNNANAWLILLTAVICYILGRRHA